jgi:hypothetical protein
MEKLVIEIDKEVFDTMLRLCEKMDFNYYANEHYTIKEVKIEDSFFENDATHKELRSQANKAYKTLKNYEYNARNK